MIVEYTPFFTGIDEYAPIFRAFHGFTGKRVHVEIPKYESAMQSLRTDIADARLHFILRM